MRTVTSKRLGEATGFIAAAGTTITFNALTLGATAPIVGGAILGVLLISHPTNYLSNRIKNAHTASMNKLRETITDESYITNASYLRKKHHCYHFCLQAASCTLGSLIGLIITSAFMSIAANPFTVPALIAGGIGLSMMIALYALTTIPAQNRMEDEMEDVRDTISLMRPALGQIRSGLHMAQNTQAAHWAGRGFLNANRRVVESSDSNLYSARSVSYRDNGAAAKAGAAHIAGGVGRNRMSFYEHEDYMGVSAAATNSGYEYSPT